MILFIGLLVGLSVQGQYRGKPENYFGFQFKPLIPFGLVGDRPFDMKEGNFATTVSPTFGYSYGAVVRVGISDLLAIETGINYTKRNFNLDYEVADSNIVGQDDFGFVNFEVPVNFLVYIKLGNQAYMNTSIGASANYNPSNIRTLSNPEGIHLFIFEGKRLAYFNYNINANVGFEYRTKESGIFYLGVSGRIPFSPLMQVAAEYSYDTYDIVSLGLIEGATFSFDLKYFFHNNKRKKGVQFKGGPIEQ
jgi:hypothetical protein